MFSFLEAIFFCNFLCCTAASGPCLVTNRKALILPEQNIDHVKSLDGGAAAHIVLTELDYQKLFSRGMASIKSMSSYIS